MDWSAETKFKPRATPKSSKPPASFRASLRFCKGPNRQKCESGGAVMEVHGLMGFAPINLFIGLGVGDRTDHSSISARLQPNDWICLIIGKKPAKRIFYPRLNFWREFLALQNNGQTCMLNVLDQF